MTELFDQVFAQLRGDDDIRELYPSFDAVPVSKKSTQLFSVLSMEPVKLDAPVPDGQNGVYPFSAVFQVSVLIPMTAHVSRAECFFYEIILPRMESLGCVLCEIIPARVDIQLQRVVFAGKFRLNGLYLPEVSE